MTLQMECFRFRNGNLLQLGEILVDSVLNIKRKSPQRIFCCQSVAAQTERVRDAQRRIDAEYTLTGRFDSDLR